MFWKHKQKYSTKQLKVKYDRARARHGMWIQPMWDPYRYVLSMREGFDALFKCIQPGDYLPADIHDATAEMSAMKRAVELRSLLLPPERRWGLVKTDSTDYANTVDSINDSFYSLVNASNLPQQAATSMLDLTIGTAGLWVEYQSDEVPLNYVAISSAQLIPEFHSSGQVQDCWFIEAKTKSEIIETYPNARKLDLKANSDDVLSVIVGNIWESSHQQWRHIEIVAEQWETPVIDVLRDYKQLIVFRDFLRPGEVHGRGIGMILLPQIKQLNGMVYKAQHAFDMRANPMLLQDTRFMANLERVSRERRWSGSIFPRPPGVEHPISAVELPTYPVVYEEIQHMQQVVRDAFAVEPLGPPELPVKSATEVSIRQDEAQRYSQTDVSRLLYELSSQLFMTSLKVLGQAERLKVNYRTLLKMIESKSIHFHYVSPLKKLEQSEELHNLAQAFQFGQQFYGEEALITGTDAVAVQEYVRDRLNLPAKLFKTREQMDALAQQKQKVEAQQQM